MCDCPTSWTREVQDRKILTGKASLPQSCFEPLERGRYPSSTEPISVVGSEAAAMAAHAASRSHLAVVRKHWRKLLDPLAIVDLAHKDVAARIDSD